MILNVKVKLGFISSAIEVDTSVGKPLEKIIGEAMKLCTGYGVSTDVTIRMDELVYRVLGNEIFSDMNRDSVQIIELPSFGKNEDGSYDVIVTPGHLYEIERISNITETMIAGTIVKKPDEPYRTPRIVRKKLDDIELVIYGLSTDGISGRFKTVLTFDDYSEFKERIYQYLADSNLLWDDTRTIQILSTWNVLNDMLIDETLEHNDKRFESMYRRRSILGGFDFDTRKVIVEICSPETLCQGYM